MTATRPSADDFPLSADTLVQVVQSTWHDLTKTRIGGSLRLGVDIDLPAQAIGTIIEKLIGHRLSQIGPWRDALTKLEKDIVHIEIDDHSFEIKTSTSPTGVFGNKSTTSNHAPKSKCRDGWHLVVNYSLLSKVNPCGRVRIIRFGKLDDCDWVGQRSNSGQQVYIPAQIAKTKLRKRYEANV